MAAAIVPVLEGMAVEALGLGVMDLVAGAVTTAGVVNVGMQQGTQLANSSADLVKAGKRLHGELGLGGHTVKRQRTGVGSGVHVETNQPVLSGTTQKKLQKSSRKAQKSAAKLTNKIHKISNTTAECEGVNKRLSALEKANRLTFSQHIHKEITCGSIEALKNRVSEGAISVMNYGALQRATELVQYLDPTTGVLIETADPNEAAFRQRIGIKNINIKVSVTNNTNKTCHGEAYFITQKVMSTSEPSNVYGDALVVAGLELADIDNVLYSPKDFRDYNRFFRHNNPKRITLRPGQTKVFFFNHKAFHWDPMIDGVGELTLSTHQQDRQTWFNIRAIGEPAHALGAAESCGTQPVQLTIEYQTTIKIEYDGQGPALLRHTYIDNRSEIAVASLASFGPKLQSDPFVISGVTNN